MDPVLGFQKFCLLRISAAFCASEPNNGIRARLYKGLIWLRVYCILQVCMCDESAMITVMIYEWYDESVDDLMMICIYTDIYMIYVCSWYENRIRYEFWIRCCRFGEICFWCPFFANKNPFLTGNERLNKTDGQSHHRRVCKAFDAV